MPLPWLVNQWACSPWQTEDGQQAAVDTETFTVLPPLTEADLAPKSSPPGPAPDEGGFWQISPSEWAESFRENWPTVEGFIPESERVTKAKDEDIRDWVNIGATPGKERTYLQCRDYAAYQVHLRKYGVSGPGHLSQGATIVGVVGRSENSKLVHDILEEEMVTALVYLREALQAQTPVMIGIRLNLWPGEGSTPNNYRATDYIELTNHFVVAHGMGRDDNGCYISFVDYQHALSDDDRLYLRDDLTLSDSIDARTLIEVRRSTKY